MSCNQEERMELVLPQSAVAQVKKAVRDAQNKVVDEMLVEGKKFWVEYAKRTRSTKKYEQAVEAWRSAYWQTSDRTGYSFGYSRPVQRMPTEAFYTLCDIFEDLAQSPRQIQVKDLATRGAKKLTNRDTTVDLGESYIRFDGRKLVWKVGYNNHAVENARQHPAAVALFAALQRVNWTRQTGGCCVFSDEHMRDDMSPGASHTRISAWFGPLGESEFEWAHGYNPRTHKRVRTRW